MAEPVRGTLTGFTNALSRHGARVVQHTDDTLATFKAQRVSRGLGNSDYAIVDGVKVYKQCLAAAMDLAQREEPIPGYMQYHYGRPYNPPVDPAQQQAKTAAAEVDALIAAVNGAQGPVHVAVPIIDSTLTATLKPGDIHAPVVGVDPAVVQQNQALAARCAELQGQNQALAARLKETSGELATVKALSPVLAENSVSVEIAGFGTIDLVVDYLWQQGNVLVIGTLKSKKRAQAIPKPSGDNIKVTFAATVQSKHYELVAFGDLRFPIGDLDVQAFLITKTIGGEQ